MDGRRHDEVVAYKIVWVGFECSKWFTKRLLAVDSREDGHWPRRCISLTYECLTIHYFYERSYNCFVRGKTGDRTEFSEPSDTSDRRTRQQCSQRQVIDTRSSAGVSLIDQFRQPGRSSEGFGIGSSCGVSRKGALGKDLFGEVDDTRIAESGGRLRFPAYGDEVETGNEGKFMEEVCGQVNQETSRAALSEDENSGLK